MADRRMISRFVVTEDRFLSLPMGAKLLYAMLIVGADDEGFIDPGATIRMFEVTREDLELLIKEEYLYSFPSGVVCIKHWNIHNTIRKQSFKASRFGMERSLLGQSPNLVYYRLEDGPPEKS